MELNSRTIRKVLTANDVGKTGSHQDGIHIPRIPEIIGFFPNLDTSTLNPRCKIRAWDEDKAQYWELNFIYYNGRTLDLNTRNEFRLTPLARFFAVHNAVEGDTLELAVSKSNEYSLALVSLESGDLPEGAATSKPIFISLTNDWSTSK